MLSLGHIFLSQHTCYIVRGGALGVHQVGATLVAVWGWVGEGTMALALLSAGFQSLAPLPQANWALLVLSPGWMGLCAF